MNLDNIKMKLKTVLKQRLGILVMTGLLISTTSLFAQKTYSLEECVQTSLNNNLQIKNGQLDIKSVNSRISQAKSSFLPTAEITGQYQYYITMPKMLVPSEFMGGAPGQYSEFVMGSPQTTSATLQVSQVLYDQKVFIGLRAAKTAKNMTDLQVSKTKEDLIYNVSAVYYNLQTLQQNLNLIDSNLVVLDKMLSANKSLVTNEIIGKTNLKRLEINFENLKNERSNLQLTVDKAYTMLKFLMGIKLTEPVLILPFKFVETVAELGNRNIENRPDVRMSKEQISLAQLDKKASVAEYYPSLSGTFNYGVTGNYDKVKPLKSFNDRWMQGTYIGLQLRIPLFSGFSRYHQVKQKDYELQKMQNNYELMKQTAEKEISDATKNYLSSYNTFSNSKRSLEVSQSVFNNSQSEYSNGLISLSDILQIQNELTTARNNYSNSLINMRLAEIEIKKANGQLNDSYLK